MLENVALTETLPPNVAEDADEICCTSFIRRKDVRVNLFQRWNNPEDDIIEMEADDAAQAARTTDNQNMEQNQEIL